MACEFFTPAPASSFHRNSSDIKSLQVSKTFLSILADLNNAVVCMVSILPLILNLISFFSKPMGIDPDNCLLRSLGNQCL